MSSLTNVGIGFKTYYSDNSSVLTINKENRVYLGVIYTFGSIGSNGWKPTMFMLRFSYDGSAFEVIKFNDVGISISITNNASSFDIRYVGSTGEESTYLSAILIGAERFY